MPAVTAENPLALPRVTAPADAAARPVLTVTTAPSGFEGEGFPVRRAFAGIDHRHLDPFIMMDQMGEVEYAPGEPKGTPWHPHRGFETVTYIIDGAFDHQDSNGGGGTITNGDTQWMTAGSGLLHIEAPPEALVMSGGLFHGLQLWVNLPAAEKMMAPRYQDIRGGNVQLLTTPDGGALLRVIAGELDGHRGPGITHTPITMVHATLAPGAEVTLPWRNDFNGLVYVLAGRGTAGAERRPIHSGQTAVFGAGSSLTVRADGRQDSRTPDLEVVLLGGRPIREPVAHYGPFVMNTREELLQAFEDFRAGRFGRVPAVHGAGGDLPF
ncbi:pirin family protein [Streptomyces somaliensis DSM 40738]|uniref:Pirin family protein n=1 Tax=Streptomyces somaliensis (strain ATCC 33201 / DSM 40738 / JCM 12659 / KCTC 9044 / NCTC 11332 / NRRL B-12077 / IP 733) TaxID=1134445 RepID=A0AA44DC74_STRE0|nr:pirin family protein [Streptomyces somaliensis]MCQ0024809.1 pirin family protein [Streptomyces somaliensis DSM 40738]NKY14188.1 pirin family protein [Streptomyces somaliensis DSM 40738]